MTKLKAYALALLAQLPDPELKPFNDETSGTTGFTVIRRDEAGDVNLIMNTLVVPEVTLAGSDEEARAAGMESIRARCPEAKGWVNHTVNCFEVPRGFIEQAFRVTAADESDETPDDSHELLM